MTARPRLFGCVTACVVGLLAVTASPFGVQAQTPAPAALPPLREGVAAIVDDDVISTYELRQRVIWLVLSTGVPATAETLPQLQSEALRSLVDERLQALEMRRQEELRKMKPGQLLVDEKRVDRFMADLAAQNRMTLAQFTRELESRGVNPKTLRDQARITLSWQQWTYGFYGRRVKIAPERIDAVMREIAESASKPSYLVSEIFIDGARAGGVENAVATGQQIIAQLQQNARFDALARQYSALPSAANGGDTGWLTSSEIEPAIARALDTMQPGQVTPPIPVSDGAYVVLLRDKRAGVVASVVNLRQAAVSLPSDATPEQVQAAQAQLAAIKAKAAGGCGGLTAAAQGVRSVQVGDLGQADITDLAPAIRAAVEPLQANQISDPVRTPQGVALIAVCSRTAAGGQMPSREDIENRLFSQELALIQRRELRNLRNAAIISQPR
jgi:peptidyl-prolyl cis-trans isomerase SurA